MSKNQKVLVTGGCGFIGSHIVDGLLQKGYKVNVIDDLSYGKKENLVRSINNIQLFEASTLDYKTLQKAAEGCSGIFHLAAHTSVQRSILEPFESHEVNARGTVNICEIAKANHARVIFSSTAAYYGDNPHLPLLETYNPNPCSHYAVQKILGEHYLNVYHQIHGLEGIALRYFNVYGPRQASNGGYSGVIKIFKDRIENNEPLTIFGDGKQTRDFVFVGDVVRANLLAMESPLKYAIMNIGTGSATTVNTIAQKTLEIMDSKNEIDYKPHRLGDPLHCYCDPSLAKKLLGFEAKTPLHKGMCMMLRSEHVYT